MLGLSGAHRTGKTTLAKKVSTDFKLPLVETQTSAVFRRMGFDPRENYPFKIRMLIQQEILADAESLYKAAGKNFVTDRTPLDYLAYTMADIQRASLEKDDSKIFMKYRNDCISVTNRYFSEIILLQPGIKIEEHVDKAPATEAYMEHINVLLMGLFTSTDIQCGKHTISKSVTDIDKRLDCVVSVCHRTEEHWFQTLQGQVIH